MTGRRHRAPAGRPRLRTRAPSEGPGAPACGPASRGAGGRRAAPPESPAPTARADAETAAGEACGAGEFLRALLDRLPLGVLTVDARSRLGHANAAALHALAVGSAGLRRDGDRIVPLDPSYDAAWRAALGEALVGEPRSLRLGERPAMTIAAWPAAGPTPQALCTLPIPEAQRSAGLDAWARANGLTDAESVILRALARGDAPKTIARLRGSTEATVRSQLKSILHKTGHDGIRELVIAALCAAPMPRLD